MPDFDRGPDRDPLRQLHDLAAEGRRHARGLPGAQVRALGARRHRRRMVASLAAASVAVAVIAGGALATTAQLQRTSGPPQPATPVPSVVPEPAKQAPLRETLLTADQTRYFESGDFEVTDTVEGEGDGPVSACQRDTLASLGAGEVWRRDFVFRDGGDLRLRTAALQLDDAATAQRAYATLRTWVEGCEPTLLQRRGFERADVRGDWYATGPGRQEFTVFTYGPVPGDRFGELSYFDATGITVVGARVMLVSMTLPGQDWNWAYAERDATGLDLHPMFATMQAAFANLRR